MKLVMIVLTSWIVVSVVLGIFVGKFIAAGNRKPMPLPIDRGSHLRVVK